MWGLGFQKKTISHSYVEHSREGQGIFRIWSAAESIWYKPTKAIKLEKAF